MNIVITQPMFFPWVGMLEQLSLADQFIFYDDVQFSKGSFVNRVQIKTVTGSKWLTVPLRRFTLGQRIQEVEIDTSRDWRHQHLNLLRQAYHEAPYYETMIGLVNEVFDADYDNIADLSIASMIVLSRFFRLDTCTTFYKSSNLPIGGSGSQRVLDIVGYLKGTRYITGLGGANYLDHEAFEKSSVEVLYMSYRKSPYNQLHGSFTPYVSSLDLVANMGFEGYSLISSGTTKWTRSVQNDLIL